MKPLLPKLAASGIALAILAISVTSARTWKSADGKSTFEGELIEYNGATSLYPMYIHGSR